MGKSTATDQGAVRLLYEIKKLMELNGENPFKSRAFERGAMMLEETDDVGKKVRAGTITELEGVGKGIEEVLIEYFKTGHSTVRDELESQLPDGLIELVRIPGLGPKRARKLIEDLGVKSVAELEYACRENRLLSLKGFGEKAQAKIFEQIQFLQSTKGQARLVDVLELAAQIRENLSKISNKKYRVEEAGSLRMRREVVSEIDFIVELPEGETKASFEKKVQAVVEEFSKKQLTALPLRVFVAERKTFGGEWIRATASEMHLAKLKAIKPANRSKDNITARDEDDFYKQYGLPTIPAEMRETGEEVKMAQTGALKDILSWDGVRGIFHNHTTASDGKATLEQMVVRAKELGYQYIGTSDHSRSAVYANGLKLDDLKKQQREVKKLQDKYPEIRIFWGIESDILKDGSLDYPESALKKFDFVIASIHARFASNKKEMTQRILKAINNKYTRFIGHISGRLLLGRPEYEVDMPELIYRCAKADVAIEINSNPARLDIDWRWGAEIRRSRTRVAINPDAHSLEGLEDVSFGVGVARKALISQELVVNAASAKEVEAWLLRR